MRATLICELLQAGPTLSAEPDVPDNMTIVLFPSRSPELNAVENIGQFLIRRSRSDGGTEADRD